MLRLKFDETLTWKWLAWHKDPQTHFLLTAQIM